MNLFELYAKITLNTEDFNEEIKSASGKFGEFGNSIKSKAKSIVLGVTAVLTGAAAAAGTFAKAAVETGATFDKSMSQVAATMGVSVEQIQDLRDFALEMGAATAFSASQAADALNYMALAGYDAQTSMRMLPIVLNLAAAGGIDLAYASDMVTDAQSALGLTAEESAKLVDKMAKASSKSSTSVEQLGTAILAIGGTAKMLAGETTELSTALGILADNGIKGSEGGTKLRNVILSLSAPVDQAKLLLDELGVEVFDAEGNMRPLVETFEALNVAMAEMTEAEKINIKNTIFNRADIAAVNALLDTSVERWRELAGEIDDAGGAAEAMANTQLDNLAGDVTLFQSALEGAKIAISDKLTPTFRDFVQRATDGITRLTDAFKHGGMEEAMVVFGEIIGEGIENLLPILVKGAAWLGKTVTQTTIDVGFGILTALFDTLTGRDSTAQLGTAGEKIGYAFADGVLSALGDLGDRMAAKLSDEMEKAWADVSVFLNAISFGLVPIHEYTEENSRLAYLSGAVKELSDDEKEFRDRQIISDYLMAKREAAAITKPATMQERLDAMGYGTKANVNINVDVSGGQSAFETADAIFYELQQRMMMGLGGG